MVRVQKRLVGPLTVAIVAWFGLDFFVLQMRDGVTRELRTTPKSEIFVCFKKKL